jgi:HAE1 family hydrophobic/amphiphilic exporter-1
MKFTETFITRPIMTSLVMLGLLFFGLVAYLIMPVSYMPAVEFPTIQVTANYPGASPKTMASNVASPLEREFSAIAGLEAMSSVNSLGKTQVTLQFNLDRNIDEAAMDVQAAITKAGGSLPDNLPNPPYFEKINPADNPVLYLSMRSPTLPMTLVNEYAKTFLTQNISTIPGVAQVLIYGEKKYAVRLVLDPRKLAAKGLGVEDVREAVARENLNLPLGTLEGRDETLTIDAKGQLYVAEEYKPIIVAYREGKPVRLGELGVIRDGAENERFGAWYNGNQNITIAIKRQPGSNTIDVVDAIKARLPGIQKQMPASIQLEVVYDQSIFIKESVRDVKFTLGLAMVLVVLVVWIFLRSIPGTFISAVAIPFSIIATYAAMYKLGFTLDNLSLLALTLCVGFVVDDAIVMLENVYRHMEMGKPPMQASLDGAKEIGFTIISMTLSLAVVFIPVLFMSGIIGRVLHEFALTITIAILISGVVSLSLTPMLCSRILRPGNAHAKNKGRFDILFERMVEFYRRTLRVAIEHRLATMLVSGALLLVTALLFLVIPKGFLPTNDIDYVWGFVQARQGISYASMRDHQRSLSPILRSDPSVIGEFQVVGVPLQNQGMTFVLLKPQADRKPTADQMVLSLMPRLNSVPGLMVFLMNPPMIEIGGKRAKGNFLFTLQSPDTDQLYPLAQKFEYAMQQLPQLTGVNSDLMIANPQAFVRINRDKAATLGVTVSDIENALYTAYGERQISSIAAQNDEYQVITQLLPEFQMDMKSLSLLYVRSKSGKLVRLDAVAGIEFSQGPVTVNHTGQLPSVTMAFNLAPGVSLGQATKVIEALAKKVLPDTITTTFEGTAEAFQKTMGSIYFLLFLAIVVIYIILGCLYESYIHPLTILSGLPSAAMGGLLTLILFGCDLNLYGYVGIIMLIGIVKKNAIMVVDFAIEREKQGLNPAEAAFEGSIVRFRPIMMTTFAAIMGALPIALGFGAGAAARRPLGLVVVGGLVFSQVVTLYLTPVFYTYMDEFQSWCGRKAAERRARRETAEASARGE